MKTLALLLLTLPAVVLAYPGYLSCQDARVREGGIIMNLWVTNNQNSGGIDILSSKGSYQEGETLQFTVKGKGKNPYNGSAIYVQTTSFCTLYGDHGRFMNLSSDLDVLQNCDSGVASNEKGFNGAGSTFNWTAGPLTVGPVTLSVLWGNGPAEGGDAYLYIKTLVLNYTGPNPPCPAISPTPAPAPKNNGSAGKCVHTGSCDAFEGVGSPLFIQSLPTEKSHVTFPAGRCLPCRVDQRHTCQTAMVECPTSWKSPQPVEKIWKNRNCTGEPDRIRKLPRSHVRCPGPDHYSTGSENLDLDRFVPKLQRDYPTKFPDAKTARNAVHEYRRMLTVAQKFVGQSIVPSKLVDLVWHEHILDTKQYKRDTLRLFGEYINHNPSFGGSDEKAELVDAQQIMFHNYAELYGEAPPAGMWPQPAKDKAGAGLPIVPDCCSALCAKPDCHNCVGCNSVDCAYLAEGVGPGGGGVEFKVDAQLSPEAAAGYVPISRLSLDLARSEGPLVCTVTPEADMKLDWAICGDQIYFEHQLTREVGWYALGLSDIVPYVDMSGADYVLSFPTGNMSGIKDAYRALPGNGYPCFDVEFECSVGNKTKGTFDLKNPQLVRQTVKGRTFTTSSWSRSLVATDSKDTTVANSNLTVLFARGETDYVYYHQGDRNVCIINFFTGMLDCRPTRPVPGRRLSQPQV